MRTSYVYFLQARNKHIKIGVSTDVRQRLSQLRTASPEKLTLLACQPGTRRDERELHKRFHYLRLNREWFRPGTELLAHIEQFKESTPLVFSDTKPTNIYTRALLQMLDDLRVKLATPRTS